MKERTPAKIRRSIGRPPGPALVRCNRRLPADVVEIVERHGKERGNITREWEEVTRAGINALRLK